MLLSNSTFYRFSPTDTKFATCSDDGSIKIWSFADAVEEQTLKGHGWDVKSIDWHPTKCLIASGSRDNLAKLWDPKSGQMLFTLYVQHSLPSLGYTKITDYNFNFLNILSH